MKQYLSTYVPLLLCSIILVSCGRIQSKVVESSFGGQVPTFKVAPTFSGTTESGRNFSTDSLRGKVWVAYFFFTSCGGPCPVMNRVVTEFVKKTENKAHFVGISVDPMTDTPEVMRTYMQRFIGSGSDSQQWTMLTMPKDSVIHVAASGFMLGSKESPELHSTRFVLIDEIGNIRGYYDGLDSLSVQQLASVLQSIR
jgi:protein SCO1/2